MLSTVLDLDGVTGVEILVKTGTFAACLAAAGSAFALLALVRFDGATARSVRQTAVAAAALAAALSALGLPIRASFLTGGSVAGAFNSAIEGTAMAIETPAALPASLRNHG